MNNDGVGSLLSHSQWVERSLNGSFGWNGPLFNLDVVLTVQQQHGVEVLQQLGERKLRLRRVERWNVSEGWDNLEITIVLVNVMKFLGGSTESNVVKNNLLVTVSVNRVFFIIVTVIVFFLFFFFIFVSFDSAQNSHRRFSSGFGVSGTLGEVCNFLKVVSNELWGNLSVFTDSTLGSLPSGVTNPATTDFKQLSSYWNILRSKENHQWSNLVRTPKFKVIFREDVCGHGSCSMWGNNVNLDVTTSPLNGNSS